jgi:hypothetical protein
MENVCNEKIKFGGGIKGKKAITVITYNSASMDGIVNFTYEADGVVKHHRMTTENLIQLIDIDKLDEILV